jgi:type IV secretory pathway VirB10-like protein
MTKSDVIRTKVDGIVKGARIVKKQFMPDGSVEVLVAMPMKGAFLNTMLPETFGGTSVSPVPVRPAPMPQKPADTRPSPPLPSPEKKAEPVKPMPPQPVQPEKKAEPAKPEPPQPPVTPPQSQPSVAFQGGVATGLVIDGRGLGLRPALLPRVLDPRGQEIYVGQVVTRTNAVEAGVAGYAKDVNAAANNFRVTDNPAVIKGVQAAGAARTDVVLGQADAQMLRDLSRRGDFLQNCRVIIVY